MTTRGIRGATTIESDSMDNVLSMTKELLVSIFKYNPDLKTEDIASAIFTTTSDITSAFPPQAAREIGWDSVPMICAQEIPVPGSLPRCIRVLIHWNTDNQQDDIQHIYLHDAKQLRPDITAQI